MKSKTYITIFACPLLLSACMNGDPQNVCSSKEIEYHESQFGINYRSLAPSPISEIFAHGEREFLFETNRVPSVTFTKNDIGPMWKGQISALLSGHMDAYNEDLKQPSVYIFQLYTPTMFQRLRTCVSPDDPQLGYITKLPRYPETVEINY